MPSAAAGGRRLLERPGKHQAGRENMEKRGERLYARWGWLAVFVTPAIVSGTAQMPPYRFALWNPLDSVGWSLPVAASAYGIGRLATGHHTGHDIAILVIGLAAGALVAVVAVGRHRRRITPASWSRREERVRRSLLTGLAAAAARWGEARSFIPFGGCGPFPARGALVARRRLGGGM
jgi:hypothetical protein